MGSHHQFRYPGQISSCIITPELSTYHKHTPEDDQSNDGDRAGGRRESLGESGEDNDDQLKTVHLLTTDNICKITETELTKDGSSGRSDLDGSIRVGGDGSVRLAVLEENNTQHGRYQVDSEDLLAC
jgi:hypothetical protein